MSLPRLVLVFPAGAPTRALSPFHMLSFAVHAFLLALIVVAPSFGKRKLTFDDAVVVDIVGSLPGASSRAAAAPPARTAPLPAPTPPKEGVRTQNRPVVPPDPSKEKAKKEKKEAKQPETATVDRPEPAAPGATDVPPGPPTLPGAAGPATAGAPGTGGITSLDAEDLEFAWYRAQITSILRTRWVRPILEDATEPIAATVVFEIRKDGSVTDVRIELGSGVAVMDRSVLRAVLESSPLPALPSSWREPSLSARYEFRFQPGEP